MFFNKLINAANNFNRPEFSKVKVVSKRRYEDELEEETR